MSSALSLSPVYSLTSLPNSNTIHFPFQVNYTTAYDSDTTVLRDIAGRCGFLQDGSTARSDLTVNYRIVLKLKVAAISVSPSFSSSASFACPLSESDISGLLSSNGINLGGALGSGSRLGKRALDDLDEEQKRSLHDQVMGRVMERGWETLARGGGALIR